MQWEVVVLEIIFLTNIAGLYIQILARGDLSPPLLIGWRGRTASKMKTTLKWRQPKNGGDLKYEDDLKNFYIDEAGAGQIPL